MKFMASVFVTKAREPEPEETDDQHPHAHIAFGGVYFFLYPAILRLRDQTGELIDPQTDAFFDGATLDNRGTVFLPNQTSGNSAWADRADHNQGFSWAEGLREELKALGYA